MVPGFPRDSAALDNSPQFGGVTPEALTEALTSQRRKKRRQTAALPNAHSQEWLCHQHTKKWRVTSDE
jgi:hypothetical protein